MVPSSITGWLSQVNTARRRELFTGTPEQSVAWVRVLACEGIPQAQVCYGRMLLDGTGTRKSERDAFIWFKRAATQGDAEACNMVGRCLENGWGAEVDMALAAAYYHASADAGHSWAQYNLGHLYLDGVGVACDVYKAYRYYLSAAVQGHPRAMSLAGRCCEEGWGTPCDLIAAALWYRRSAEAGYFRGQYNWASILLKCHRVAEAAAWFEEAAKSGTPAVRAAVLRVAASPDSAPCMAALATRLVAGGELLNT